MPHLSEVREGEKSGPGKGKAGWEMGDLGRAQEGKKETQKGEEERRLGLSCTGLDAEAWTGLSFILFF